ncbi:hypothetical protein HBI40_211420 [Parastagonospora nodorum]|nr:hypothetical protein HBI06_195270 [Parastagonospora nodorum]KAH4227696.1 hypothetical protein HBI05_209210 [Parastagonospora nodorum]KAH5176194.1 hypothetical protein HBH76_213440 [Parastagonospora nodorum]KAH5301625.1 hypothetical protein HBI50_203130 [Parastagonospora nodorum]KAH5484134.1 hypothetical protein HBI31_169660 [Parastagonospora nodorum]
MRPGFDVTASFILSHTGSVWFALPFMELVVSTLHVSSEPFLSFCFVRASEWTGLQVRYLLD